MFATFKLGHSRKRPRLGKRNEMQARRTTPRLTTGTSFQLPIFRGFTSSLCLFSSRVVVEQRAWNVAPVFNLCCCCCTFFALLSYTIRNCNTKLSLAVFDNKKKATHEYRLESHSSHWWWVAPSCYRLIMPLGMMTRLRHGATTVCFVVCLVVETVVFLHSLVLSTLPYIDYVCTWSHHKHNLQHGISALSIGAFHELSSIPFPFHHFPRERKPINRGWYDSLQGYSRYPTLSHWASNVHLAICSSTCAVSRSWSCGTRRKKL